MSACTQRKEGSINRSLILAAIATRELSAPEIAAFIGVSAQTVRGHLRMLHAERGIYIKRWYRGACFKWERMWAAGAGEDAKKPRPRTVKEQTAANRQRRKTDVEFALQQQAAWRRAKIKQRKPKADIAASWIQ